MNIFKLIFITTFLFITSFAKAQTFIYSYTDPCTGLMKSMNVPVNGVTVTYFGQIQTFSPNDFQNGVFETWANNVYNSFGGGNPCGSIIGVSTAVDIAQGTVINFISVINNISALSDLQQSLSGPGGSLNTMSAIESAKSSSNKKDKKKDKSSNNSSSNSGQVNGQNNNQVSQTNGQSDNQTNSSTGQSNGTNNQSNSSNGQNNAQSNGSNGQSNSQSSNQTNNSTEQSNAANEQVNGSNGQSNGQTNDQSNGSNGQSNSQSNGSNSQSNSQSNGSNSQSNGSNSQSNGQTNGQSNNQSNGSNGQTNGQSNGSSGQTNGQSNSQLNGSNGQSNSQSNGSSGQTNGQSNGSNGQSNAQSNGSNDQNNNQSNNQPNSSNSQSNEQPNNTQPNGEAGSTTNNSGSTNSQQSSNSSQNVNGDNSGNGNPPNNSENTTQNTEDKKTNFLGGTVNSTQRSTEANKPQIVLSSDFAGFNFKNNDVTFGGKGTGGFTSLSWDGRRSYGVLLDYTSIIRGPNLTAFYANLAKRRIDLISLTGTVSFYGRGSQYASLALGQMWNLNKKKSLKALYMATASFGNVYGERFLGTAFIAGGMYDWRIHKRVDIKMMNLFIYAPYVSYYNDILLKSPYVIMPIVGTNIGITKKFKFNINFGGAYAINENLMNFTLMFGTRFAL